MTADENQWAARQVVASNLKRLRTGRRWTQAEAADRISEHLLGSWSEKTYGNAEGTRPRVFTAEELLAVALTFGVPIIELFQPPEDLPSGTLAEQLAELERVDARRSSVIPTNSEEAIRLALLDLSRDQKQAALNAKKIADRFKRR